MKPRRAFGLIAVTVLLACLAAWMTPQQHFPAALPTTPDSVDLPALFEPR